MNTKGIETLSIAVGERNATEQTASTEHRGPILKAPDTNVFRYVYAFYMKTNGTKPSDGVYKTVLNSENK